MKNLAFTLVFFVVFATAVTSAQTPNSATPRGAFVDVDGGRIHFEECGSGTDALVLLHDGVVNSAVGMTCGHLSANGSTRSVTTAEVTGILRRRRNRITKRMTRRLSCPPGKSHTALVASSHGGEVALNFTLRYTAVVSDLVLAGPAASGFPYSEHFLMRERANSQSDKAQDLMDASVRDAFLIVPGHDAARKRLHDLPTAAPQDLTHEDMPLPERSNFPYVQRLRVPALILIGSGDIADNQAIAGALVMAIPGAAGVVVPDAGHLMYLEKPEIFSGLVSTFLIAHGF